MKSTATKILTLSGLIGALLYTLPVQADDSSSLVHPAPSLVNPAKLPSSSAKLTNGSTNLVNSGQSLVNSGGSLVNPGGSLVHPGGSLIHPGSSLVHPSGPLIHPVKLLGNGVSLLEEGKCNHHLMVGTDTLFAFDKADLTPAAQATLTKLGSLIKAYGSHPATVEGHTDGKGTDQYNQPLSERRAQAVKDWLIKRNFVSAQTAVAGFGKKRPIAPNTKPDGSDNPAGRQLNRRVEVVVDTCH